jgi:hypothetical protein
MACHRIGALALLAAGAVLAPPAQAGAPPARRQPDDAAKLAAKIDEHIGAGYARARVKPAAPVDDAIFFRRVSLDVVGRIPPSMDVRRFLADRAPDKRARAVERLLDTPGYANHFTNIWRDLLLPEATTDINRRYLTPAMERWLFKQFSENAPYDQMVRDILTLPLDKARDGRYVEEIYFGGGNIATPMPFFLAKEGKAEELAAATARLFLGVRLECAQCHDHPFGKWKREQFWGQAAFFAGIRRSGRGGDFFVGDLREVNDRRELAIPNTERVAQARFLDGKEPRWRYKVNARTTLADWMVARDNPFFARAAVNRMWAHFFGIGLVDPVDDFNDANLPSHPELLDELARQFAAHNFDFKFLIRAITQSKTYQLSSVYTGPAPDARLFARMPVKGLSGEQLYDSILMATGIRDNTPRRQRAFFFGSERQQFLEKFAAQEKRTETLTSIPQALTLMNNQMIANATHPDRSAVLGAVANAPFMTTAGRVEALYLAALSRKPRSDELARFTRYVDSGGAAGDKKKALSDVFWALLNSTEFILNH